MSAKSNIKTEKTLKKNGFLSFFKEVKAEVKRITWPTKNETKKALVAVVIFMLIYAILVGGLDAIFKTLLKLILNLK